MNEIREYWNQKIHIFGCQKLSRTAPDPEMEKGRAQALVWLWDNAAKERKGQWGFDDKAKEKIL